MPGKSGPFSALALLAATLVLIAAEEQGIKFAPGANKVAIFFLICTNAK